MNYIRILLIVMSITIISFSLINLDSSVHSQTEKDLFSDYGVFIFVQTFLENSNGQKITYLTSDKFTDLNDKALEVLLDNEVSENDPIITINDQKYQVIKRKLTITYDKENVIASTILASTNENTLTTVARFSHDGYPIVSGDKVHSIWTFIRPLK